MSGADHDQAIRAGWKGRPKRQRNHPAVRCSDDSMEAIDAGVIESGSKGMSLIVRRNGRARSRALQVVEGDDAKFRGVNGALVADHIFPPTCARVKRRRCHMLRGRNTAKDCHHWCPDGAG